MLAPELKGDGVALRPFEEGDVTDRYVGWMRDPAVVAMTEVDPATASRETCLEYVRANRLDPAALLWRIFSDDSGHVGNLRMTVDRRHRRGELALIVGRTDLHGRGIGRAAIELACDHGFSTLGLHKLTCGMYAGNHASRRAFEARGFRVEARLLDHAVVDGRFEDVLRMARFAPGEGTR